MNWQKINNDAERQSFIDGYNPHPEDLCGDGLPTEYPFWVREIKEFDIRGGGYAYVLAVVTPQDLAEFTV